MATLRPTGLEASATRQVPLAYQFAESSRPTSQEIRLAAECALQ
jgi:hypothetical protein